MKKLILKWCMLHHRLLGQDKLFIFNTPDTDVLILLLSILPSLGLDTVLITGSGENRRNVKLRYIYDELGENYAKFLLGMHALSGCDTTGHIMTKSKSSWFNAF